MILDGWGITQDPKVSAIYNAKTPFINGLYNKYPNAELRTDGEHVGLPEGQMGNSEVGHMNLGAGRIVYQNLARINKAVKEKTLGQEKVLIDTFKYAKENNKNVRIDDLYHLELEDKDFEINDEQLKILNKLTYLERELLKLNQTMSYREIQRQLNINYQFARRVIIKVQEKYGKANKK